MHTRTRPRFGAALVAVLFLMPALAAAQGFQRMSAEEQLAMQLERMTDRLDLTEEQVTLITPILEETIAQRQAKREELMANGRSRETREAMRAEMDKLNAAQAEKLEGILTETQRAEYAKMQKERPNRRARRARRG